MKEALRAQLETAAGNRGVSMNDEGVSRLRQSFVDEERLFKDQHTMALVHLMVGTIQLIEAHTGEKWTGDSRTREAVTAIVVAFLNGDRGVPFHKPPIQDEQGNRLNDEFWLMEAPQTAIADAVRGLLMMRGVTEQTIDMVERLVMTDGDRHDPLQAGESTSHTIKEEQTK